MYLGPVTFEALVPLPAVMTGKSGEVAEASVEVDDSSHPTPLKHVDVEDASVEVVDASMKVVDASVEKRDASVNEEEDTSVVLEDASSVEEGGASVVEEEGSASVEEEDTSVELEDASVELEDTSAELEDTSVEVEDAVSSACLLCRASRGTINAIVLITGTGVTTTVRTGGAVSQTGVVKSGTGPPGQEV